MVVITMLSRNAGRDLTIGKHWNALKTIEKEDFKAREFYLKKWSLKLNANGTHIDYHGFTKKQGVVQTPQLSLNK